MRTAGESKEYRNKRYIICANGPPIMKHVRFNRTVVKKETKEQIQLEFEEFVYCHGMAENNDYVNYHMSLGFYYAYFVEAMKYATSIDGGEVFDETEVSIIIRNLELAKRAFLYYRTKLGIAIFPFDTAETILMEDCRLEKGEIIGNKQNALANARKWFNEFKQNGNLQYKEGMVEKSVSRAFFLYEVAMFIYYLLEEDVSYGFLGE